MVEYYFKGGLLMISVGREITAQMSGIFCCRNDLNLTLVGDTTGLVGLTGFSVNELQEIHQNNLMSLVSPIYRDKLRKELAEQLAESNQVEEVFPLVCRDESVKWLMCRGCGGTRKTGRNIWQVFW